MNELGLLLLLGSILVFFIVLNDIRKKQYKNLRDYFIIGSLAALFDIIIETVGTFNSFWTYNESIYFLFGTVPIELPLMFFMAGVLGKWIHGISKKIKYNLQLNIIFFSLTLFGIILYFRSTVLLGIDEDVAIFAIPAALWGFHVIKNEVDKASVLIVALFVAILDYILEVIIVGTGSYTYLTGFELSIPLTYFLITIAFFGLMEKLNVLDNILEYPIIKQVIQTSGIKRQEYLTRIKSRIKR
jgi:hypothetical protein